MPNLKPTEQAPLLPGTEQPSPEQCESVLEAIVKQASSIVLYNWRFGHSGFGEAEKLARSLMGNSGKVYVMKIDENSFGRLHISVPYDVEQAFRSGRPIVVSPIPREPRTLNPSNRPLDTPLITGAKDALNLTAFRLQASQGVVEFWRGAKTRRKEVTRGQATVNAGKRLVGLDPFDLDVTDKHPSLLWFKGLIDRGRRRAAGFFNVGAARRAAQRFAEQTRSRLGEGGNPDVLEADHVEQLRAAKSHEARAVKRERAMERWAHSAQAKQPIEPNDMRELANAHIERQNARELMRIAIDGSLNPADVQGHLRLMADAFETGRKVGMALRGHEVELDVEDARHIRQAIFRARRRIIETDEDGAYLYLADALARFSAPLEWEDIAMRITASEAPEMAPRTGNLT